MLLELQPRGLRVGLPQSTILRAQEGKAGAGTTLQPPTAMGCGCRLLCLLRKVYRVRMHGARRPWEGLLLPTGQPMAWAMAPGAAPLFLTPRLPVFHINTAAAHSSASWVTAPLYCPLAHCLLQPHTALLLVQFLLSPGRNEISFPGLPHPTSATLHKTGREKLSRSGVSGFCRGHGT